MGLVSWTVGLPLLPVRGVLAIGGLIEEQAERERASTATARRRLEAVEREYAGGSDPRSARDQAEQVEQIVGELVRPTPVVAPESAGGRRTKSTARPSRAQDEGDG
jgi:hypothetical protein